MLNIKKALAVWAVLLCLNSNNVIALEAGVQKINILITAMSLSVMISLKSLTERFLPLTEG